MSEEVSQVPEVSVERFKPIQRDCDSSLLFFFLLLVILFCGYCYGY